MNILFTLNQNYIPQLIVCVRSIARFQVPGGYDIYIGHQSFSDENIAFINAQNIPGVRFHFIALTQTYFDQFPNTAGYPKEMYFRLIAAKFLPAHLDRILYLDPDIIVIKSLDTLYQLPFDGNLFIATTHVKKTLTKINIKRLGLQENVPYINTGVLLINLTELRKETTIEEDIESFVMSHKAVLTLPDQDVITALFGHLVKLIDPMIYNLSDRMLAFHNLSNLHQTYDSQWVNENTVIIHYCGKNKPWNPHYIGILGKYYTDLAKENVHA